MVGIRIEKDKEKDKQHRTKKNPMEVKKEKKNRFSY